MSDSSLLVSFVIPAWNAEATLSETLESVARQSVGDWEIVLVDDGSSDGTASIAADWSRRDPRLRVFTQENMGFTTARNLGLQKCRGRWISFLDADDLIEPAYIAETAGAFDSDPAVGVVTCGWRYLYTDGSVSDPTVFGAGRIADPLATLLARPILFGSAVLRRDLGERIAFDASLGSSGDFLYWFQLLSSGVEIVGVPQPLFLYRQVPSSLSRRDPLRCLREDFAVWNQVERLVPSAETPGVRRRKRIAVISYCCRMIALGRDPWTEECRIHFSLLGELSTEELAVSITEMLPTYLGRSSETWPLVYEESRSRIEEFVQDLQRHSILTRDAAANVMVRLERDAAEELLAAVDSSSIEGVLAAALQANRSPEQSERTLQFPTAFESGPAAVDRQHVGRRSPTQTSPLAPDGTTLDREGAGALQRLFAYASRRVRAQSRAVLPLEVDLRAGSSDPTIYGAGGWSWPESWGAWTDGTEARALVALRADGSEDVSLEIEVEHVFCPDPGSPLRVTVEVNGTVVKEAALSSASLEAQRVIAARIPRALIEPLGGLLIVLRMRGVGSPRSLGISEDARRLGLGVRKFRFR